MAASLTVSWKKIIEHLRIFFKELFHCFSVKPQLPILVKQNIDYNVGNKQDSPNISVKTLSAYFSLLLTKLLKQW